MSTASPGWTVLVPVKATTRGKSRIDLPAADRRRLALAMALDTVSAVARCSSVLAVVAVVEDSADAARIGSVDGVRVHRTRVTGLNESLVDALTSLSGWGRRGGSGVAVLPGDLPGLLSEELREALEASAGHRLSVVADHQGDGTTLLAATDPAALHPQYGPDSYRRHRAAGAIALELPAASSLRWDVDTVADLDVMPGPFTRAVLAGLEVVPPCR